MMSALRKLTTSVDATALLLTPGPLTTSLGVKQAMLRDLGSRDQQMIDVVQGVRHFTNIPGQRDKKVVITSHTDMDGHRTDRHDPLVNTAVF